ncbi:class I glutamine amidotransferase-like protein [Stereum hirsutum FP-91666 SS1]|uniref:class I glutamine amidotransferase-like protein n=1 Tax=Stereum hirsutum (strain FP-91666) TaxID=721885 RepID=UPI000440ACEA|nr:class I glutamine amidotransferase-like protein [Stereum hirsutum FP-91666 SS1]EIM91564.1 class I glutamine amidotransferase-like protein [Stereum hirsutum FP-91666 SS1]
MSSAASPLEKVLLLAYDDMNTLDWAGPLEVLSMATTPSGSPVFEVTIATVSSSPNTTSPLPSVQTAERGIITPHVNIASRSPDLPQILEGYSTLVIPGGPVSTLLRLANDTSGPIIELIRAFAALPPKDARGYERIIFTICTGAFHLPATGILRRSSAAKREIQLVTHWSARDELRGLADKYTDKGCRVEVLNDKRFVDAGKLLGTGEGGEGVRLVTSGGVSAGMDAALYVTERRAGTECAKGSAKMIETVWRREEGVIASD